jgi:hypothetical protein
MVTFNDVVEVEEKYKKMKDGTAILFGRIDENDAIRTMQGCFRSFLEKKGFDSVRASAVSEIFAFDLVLFEEAMETERKKRFFDFVSSTFSKEFLRGKEEKELFEKALKRMGKKLKREEKKLKVVKK